MGNLLDNLDGIPGAKHVINRQQNPVSKVASTNSSTVMPASNNSGSNETTPNTNAAYLRGIDGEYTGRRIIIHDGDTYTFGRSPKNQIVFPDKTPGVSRLHMSIKSVASEKKIILVDLDSSYGTYDGLKRRFVSNCQYELREGAEIEFGENQRFLVGFY